MDPLIIKLTIDPETADRLQLQKPRSLPLATFCALLIEQGLDTPATLGVQSAAGTPSTSISSTTLEVSKEKKERKVGKRAEITPEFEAFWKAYQSCPRKVPSQSKAKSWEEWQKAIKQETPERLLQAAKSAVSDAVSCEWDYKLPDCFRWLRDGRYSVLLETHAVAQREGDWI